MTVVALTYFNGITTVTRDLMVADACPKCGTLAAEYLCRGGCKGHEYDCIANSHVAVRCALCTDTQYARPWGVRPDPECWVESSTERALRKALDNTDRLQTAVDAGLESARRHEAGAVIEGRLERVPNAAGTVVFEDAWTIVPVRSLRERLRDAVRGALAGWRGVA